MSKASLLAMLFGLISVSVQVDTKSADGLSYQQAHWTPLHFKPAAETATDEQCLACHAEVLEKSVRPESPAGVKASDALAWYETLDTYQGEEETFHRRHLVSDYAKQVMALKCNTCHQGDDPREDSAVSHVGADPSLTMRKQVDPNICLMCHGQFPYRNMGVPGPWLEAGSAFQNNCLLCHVTFRTNRHNVNYLKPQAIEDLAKKKEDVCFGCHGGRPWYRISYPYPRHLYPAMATVVPDWAKDRPTESEPRFLVGIIKPAETPVPQAQPPAPEAKAPETKAIESGQGDQPQDKQR